MERDYDFEEFEIELDNMLDDAEIFGLSDSEREGLSEALLEDWEDDPKQAFQNLSFWKMEYSGLLGEEMEAAA